VNASSRSTRRPRVLDLITELRRLDGSFARGEQRVASHVLEHLEEVVYQNQSGIANAAGVSVATVNRFCQTLGCQGFKDFRIAFAQSVAVSLQYLAALKSEDGTTTELLTDQVFDTLQDALAVARKQLHFDAMEAVVEHLARARRIVFLGVGGGSANVAREGANRFFRLGIPAEAHADGYLQRMVAATLSVDDVLVAISSSGAPLELLDSVSIANQYGATTLALTRSGSDLARVVDVAIELSLPEDQDIYKPSASRLVSIAIIDVLAAAVARRRPDVVKENLRRIRTSLVGLVGDRVAAPVGD